MWFAKKGKSVARQLKMVTLLIAAVRWRWLMIKSVVHKKEKRRNLEEDNFGNFP